MLRQRLFAILENTGPHDRTAATFDVAMVALILANVTAVVAESVPDVAKAHAQPLAMFERVSLLIFAVEYALRLWSCTTDPRFARPVTGRLRCAARPLVVIDLLVFLPGLLALTADLRWLRLLRLLRMLKVARYSTALQTFARILKQCAPELLSTLFVMLLLLVMSSSLMYFLEKDTPNSAFTSIPAAMWWGIATFTTVGYGDITPTTAVGRLLGGCVAVLGIAMFAIPAGVLGAAFSEELRRKREDKGGHGDH